MQLTGKYETAIIYNDLVEDEAISQTMALLNHSMSENTHVCIMPDIHAGAGCVIGYTARLNNRIVPNIIGVDIGCGVGAFNLGKVIPNFDKLDKFIRNNIPSGKKIRSELFDEAIMMSVLKTFNRDISFNDWIKELEDISKNTDQDQDYVKYSLGTLGGGNHFIELDKDDGGNVWLLIHSGSRNYGLQIAKYHQNVAVENRLGLGQVEYEKKVNEIKKKFSGKQIEKEINKLRNIAKSKLTGLEYLEDEYADNYIKDMKNAQIYAMLNRRIMAFEIVEKFFKLKFDELDAVESVHNYINFNDRVVRKGAISAHKDEKVIIPLNMADGSIIGTGKGNEEWNNSAPHGAGRKMSRGKAKGSISLDIFRKKMREKGVWSSCVGKGTLDESPMAYKKSEEIIKYLEPTVEIISHMKSIYNFKASE